MRIKIDADLCQGHGRCYSLSPSLFEPDDYGHGVVLRDEIGDLDLAAAKLAADACPEHAITILD